MTEQNPTKKPDWLSMPKLTPAQALPEQAIRPTGRNTSYPHRFTSGPFYLPEDAVALDWVVLNNDFDTVRVRVTVFSCPLGSNKAPAPPGAIDLILDSGETAHNANAYPVGMIYEVVLESTSLLVFPSVSAWSNNAGEVIPGTTILAAGFIRHMPSI